jgi:hypothetical protein
LRSGSLSSLLALAGGTSEIGYATDANALVIFNGTANQAKISSGGSILDFVFTNANVAAYTTGTSYIDCNNITTLNVSFDPTCTTQISNINIKLPLSSQIQQFTVNFIDVGSGVNYDQITGLYITVGFQAAEGNPFYNAIGADDYGFGGTGAHIVLSAISTTLQIIFNGSFTSGWTRYPSLDIDEGGFNATGIVGTTSRGYFKLNTTTNPALTNNVVSNTGSITIPSTGIWLIIGFVRFTCSSTLVCTRLSACFKGLNTTANPTSLNYSEGGVIVTPGISTPATTSYDITIPPLILSATQGQQYYQNVFALFSAGTLNATIYCRAIKLA